MTQRHMLTVFAACCFTNFRLSPASGTFFLNPMAKIDCRILVSKVILKIKSFYFSGSIDQTAVKVHFIKLASSCSGSMWPQAFHGLSSTFTPTRSAC